MPATKSSATIAGQAIMNPARIRFVLLRTHHGKNLGAAARALANFGLPNLVLAELGAVDWSDVDQTAVRAKHITEGARRVATLERAIDGCAWVVGTTMRSLPGQRHLHPRAVAEHLAAVSLTQDAAIVFGPERTGLTNRDLLLCHDVSVIPTAHMPSLNLSQAVLLYAWELFAQRARAPAPHPERATGHDYDRLEAAMRAYLARARFADPDRPRHGVIDLMQTLKRAGLSPREARLWEAVLRNA